MILLSIASKQIWPQVLAVAHLKPRQLVLLHSDHPNESKGPAQRLKHFFDESGLIRPGGTRLERLSDSDFDAIERRLDDIQKQHQILLAECVVNITGGNKLMATAAFRWAARHARAFYLERQNQLTWFEAHDGRMITRRESIDGHLTDDLDPVSLLRCQLDASEIERIGQVLELNDAGQRLSEVSLFERIAEGGADSRQWLRIEGEADRNSKAGDRLEFSSALVLLKLGVRRVQRGLRLKVKSARGVGTRLPHAEIDLLFTWAGRLWLVDCKDQMQVDDLVGQLRRHLPTSLTQKAESLLTQISERLSISQTKVLKEDLLAVRETGGLLGNVVCVRKAVLSDEVLQYAKHNQMEVVEKRDMVARFRTLLNPAAPASQEQLGDLARQFGAIGGH